MEHLDYCKKIEVRHTPDVLVVGGGPAGCAAAWAAARTGAKVFLAEGHSCLGGLGTAGMVPAYMQFGDGVNNLSAGFGSALFGRLKALGERVGQPQLSMEIRAENLKRVSEEMLKEAGVEFVFHTQLIDVIAADGMIETACSLCPTSTCPACGRYPRRALAAATSAMCTTWTPPMSAASLSA